MLNALVLPVTSPCGSHQSCRPTRDRRPALLIALLRNWRRYKRRRWLATPAGSGCFGGLCCGHRLTRKDSKTKTALRSAPRDVQHTESEEHDKVLYQVRKKFITLWYDVSHVNNISIYVQKPFTTGYRGTVFGGNLARDVGASTGHIKEFESEKYKQKFESKNYGMVSSARRGESEFLKK